MKDLEIIKERIAYHNDQKSFRKFFNFYYKRLFTFSLRILKSKEVSEEVVSDIFIKLWENREKLLEIKNIETYLYKSVRNQSLNVIKQKLSKHNEHLSLDQAHLEFAIECFTPENVYFADELRNYIDQVVEKLPPACKTSFLLVKEDGLSYQEAAKILEISPLTVKKQSLKAIKAIRAKLTEKEKSEKERTLGITKISSMLPILFFLDFFANCVLR